MDSFEEDLAYFLPFDEAESDENSIKKSASINCSKKPLIVNDTRSANNAVLYNVMASAAILREDYKEAINFCTRGLQEIVPYCEMSVYLYSIRAKALECLEMYEESLIDIDRAIEISPNTELTKRFKDTKMDLEKKASRPHTKQNNRNHFEDIPCYRTTKTKIFLV